MPLWLGNGLYQYLSEGHRHVAYTAHFGGLLGDAGGGALYRWLPPKTVSERHQEAEREKLGTDAFQRGIDIWAHWSFARRWIFKSLLAKHPAA